LGPVVKLQREVKIAFCGIGRTRNHRALGAGKTEGNGRPAENHEYNIFRPRKPGTILKKNVRLVEHSWEMQQGTGRKITFSLVRKGKNQNRFRRFAPQSREGDLLNTNWRLHRFTPHTGGGVAAGGFALPGGVCSNTRLF